MKEIYVLVRHQTDLRRDERITFAVGAYSSLDGVIAAMGSAMTYATRHEGEGPGFCGFEFYPLTLDKEIT